MRTISFRLGGVDRWFLFANGHVDRLPFARLEDQFATKVWALPAKSAQIHDLPRDDRIDSQAIQDSLQVSNCRSSIRQPDFKVRK